MAPAEKNERYDDLKKLKEELERQQNSATEKMQGELAHLTEMVGQLCGMSSMEHVLQHGFHLIKEQLAPLRELSPQRTPLDEEANNRLRNIRESLIHPAWDGIDYLVPTNRVDQPLPSTSSPVLYAKHRSTAS